jgi:large subunit ribosomal protein L40e/ubiquitin C
MSSFCQNPFIHNSNKAISIDLISKLQMIDGLLNKLYQHPLPFQINNAKLENDYKRFIFIKMVTQDIDGTVISPTIDIDEVWHQHLLYNKDYLEMCIKINFIVYHYPQHSDDSIKVKNKRIETFKIIYQEYFQNIPFGYIDISNNNNSELVSSVKSEPVQIFIKTITNKTVVIEISLDNTIGELKQMIYIKEGICIETQKFIFAGKYISYDNKKTLRELNIEKDSIIHIMLMLKGC